MTQSTTIRVAVAGAQGRMGREAIQAVTNAAQLQLAGALVHRPGHEADIPQTSVYTDPLRLLETEKPDVWLDLTTPESVVGHVDLAIEHGVYPVIGATGYQDTDFERWQIATEKNDIGGLACPNFALGALLMMRFAREAAKWMQSAEIIELHHDQKKDKPSGTALRTAKQMETDYEIPIHSVRLPGLVAHQEVIFGGTGELLTIRHDSLNRESFMPGVVIACERVIRLRGMVYGLEQLLW